MLTRAKAGPSRSPGAATPLPTLPRKGGGVRVLADELRPGTQVRDEPTLPSPPLRGRVGEGGTGTPSPVQKNSLRERSCGSAYPPPYPPPQGGRGAPAHEEVSDRQRGQAKRLRRGLTAAERRLWHALRAHRFSSFQFRRQAPMGPYIADFVSHGAKLVIEVDGAQHGFDGNALADRRRDEWFRERGYAVLRFWNHDVLTRTESVIETIYARMPAGAGFGGQVQ